MKPRRLLFVTYGFSVGGAERFLVNLLNGLDRSSTVPLVVSLNHPGKLEEQLDPGIQVMHFPRASKLDFSQVSKIAALLEEYDIDTAFVLSLYCNMFLHRALRRTKRRVRTIISLHATSPRSVKDDLLTRLYARFLQGNETIVTVSTNQARYLARRYGIDAAQFTTIHNGVDVSHWTVPPDGFDRSAARKNLDVPPEAPVLIMVAALRPEKRHEDALQALHHWKNAFVEPLPYLLIVGDGDSDRLQELEALAGRLGVGGNVRYVGVQADPRPYYWMADVFTLSSAAVETFSMAALEAMASGLPCVLTDIGGASEMIVEGTNGICVPCRAPDLLAAGWRKALQKETAVSADRIRAHVVQHFSLTRCVQRYEQLLRDRTSSVSADVAL